MTHRSTLALAALACALAPWTAPAVHAQPLPGGPVPTPVAPPAIVQTAPATPIPNLANVPPGSTVVIIIVPSAKAIGLIPAPTATTPSILFPDTPAPNPAPTLPSAGPSPEALMPLMPTPTIAPDRAPSDEAKARLDDMEKRLKRTEASLDTMVRLMEQQTKQFAELNKALQGVSGATPPAPRFIRPDAPTTAPVAPIPPPMELPNR